MHGLGNIEPTKQPSYTYVTGPAKINHVSANYTYVVR